MLTLLAHCERATFGRRRQGIIFKGAHKYCFLEIILNPPHFLTPHLAALRSKRCFTNAVARLAILTAVFCAVGAHGYVQEGASWPNGSTVTFQFALGSAGRTLSDGNSSWDTAAMPAPTVWNSNVQGL